MRQLDHLLGRMANLTTLMIAMLIGYAVVALSYMFHLNPAAPKM